MANSSGGKIIIGVQADRKIKGYFLSDKDKSIIQDIARNMDPSFRVNMEQVDDCAVIYVPEGKDKPYAINGQFFLRIGANSQQLKRDEIRELFQRENRIYFDRKSNSDFNSKKDFDNKKYNTFIKKAMISASLPKAHVLQNLNLITSDQINNTGVLFFSKNKNKFFLNASIVCVLFQGNDRVTIIDRKEYNTDLLSDLDNAYNYLRSHLNTNFIIKGKSLERKERLELPEEALREAIINSLIHRDYFSQGHVQIDVFLDRVEISNPGHLLFDKKALGTLSIPRNPIIMDMVYRLKLVEKIGSGINRIKKLMKEYGLAVSFEISSNWFRIIFPRNIPKKTVEKTVEKTREKTREKILALINDNPLITQQELMKKAGLTRRGIEWNIKKLKSQGIIKRIGPDKGGHWKVIK